MPHDALGSGCFLHHYREEKGGPEELSNLPEITEPGGKLHQPDSRASLQKLNARRTPGFLQITPFFQNQGLCEGLRGSSVRESRQEGRGRRLTSAVSRGFCCLNCRMVIAIASFFLFKDHLLNHTPHHFACFYVMYMSVLSACVTCESFVCPEARRGHLIPKN